MRNASKPTNAGQAPTDLTLVLALLFASANLEVLVKSGFLIGHGELRGGLSIAVNRVASELQWPLLLLFAGFAVVVAGAGRRRDLGKSSDLACVAFMPVVAVGAMQALWQALVGPLPFALVAAVAACWFSVVLVFAVREARRGDPAVEGSA